MKTDINLKNETATVTVINNSTVKIGAGTNKKTANGDFTIFKNISSPNGSFSVKYRCLQAGTHQIIARINSKSTPFKALASFNVIVMGSY